MSSAATEESFWTAAASKMLCSTGSRSRMSPAHLLLRGRSAHRKTCSGKSKKPKEQRSPLKMGRRSLSNVRVAGTGCVGLKLYGIELELAAWLVALRVVLGLERSC